MDGFTVTNGNRFLETGRLDTGRINSGESRIDGSSSQIETTGSGSFADTLKEAVMNVNEAQKNSDKAIQALATGKTDNVAEVMIATEKADIALKLMVQVRNKIIDAYQKCDQDLDIEFERISEEFEMENNDRCDVQLQNIEAYQQRKTESLSQRIEKFKIEGKLRMIPAFEGQLRKLEQDCQVNKKRLDKKRNVEFSNPKLAAGLIFVKEG